jgi:hypothetical protein
MGIPASGATLEIQLVADVARLQRDMKAMQDVVGAATVSAGKSFNDLAKGSAAAAAAQAAAAQASARAATTGAAGIKAMGASSGLARVQLMELSHVTTSLSGSLIAGQNPLRAIALELPRIAQAATLGGTGISGMIRSIAEMTGIIKVTTDAELAATAAATAAGAAVVKRNAERAASTLALKQAQAAQLKTEYELVVGTDLEAAAMGRLVKAQRAVIDQSAVLAGVQRTLAAASTEAAVAAEASQAATVTSIGAIGAAAAVAALVIGLVGAAFLGVKQGAEAADPGAKQLNATLGLTDKQIAKLKDTSVSWGDVFGATMDVMLEKAGISADGVKKWFTNAFHTIGDFGKFSVAIIIAAFVTLGKTVYDVFTKLPSLVGEAAIGAANLAIAGIEKLANLGIAALNKISATINNSLIGQGIKKAFGVELPQLASISLGRIQNQFAGTWAAVGSDIKKSFYGTFYSVEATFDAISARADQRRDQRVRDQASAMKKADDDVADSTGKAAKAHHERAAAANEEAAAIDKLHQQLEKLMAHPADVDLDVKPPSQLEGPDLSALQISQDQLLAGPNALLDTLQQVADQAQATGQIMRDSFGDVGGVFGSLIANVADYGMAQQQLAIDVLKGNKTQEQADKTLGTLRSRSTAQALSSLKGLFKEHSTGYKVMSAIEKAYAIFQAAETALAISREFLKTATTVTQAGIRTTANTAEGGSKIFAELGPWAFPVVAAMVALLAALGASAGGGGGSSGPSIPSADDIQAGNGAGTVLGDSAAKSESIKHALEIVAANSNKDLEYSNQMLRSLRNIDLSISKLAGTVARQIQVSGSLFDTSKLKLGDTGSSGFLGLIGGSKTSKTLFDLGINLAASSVGDIIANGISGSSYQIVQKIKTSNGFLGIGGGTKTSYSTTTGTVDPEITKAIQDVIMSLRDGLVSAADVIGLEGAQAILDSFQVNIGKISFKDLTGQEIEDQLNAIFSKVGDQMAGALFPTLASMQKVGEGLFETFIRVAREYQVIDLELKSIGKTFGAVGVGSIAARDALVQLFDSLDDFVEKTDFFRDQFLSEAEQLAPVQASVVAEMQRLGLAGVTTRDQFKQAVLGLDLTTAAGREMYAALLAVAPAFDKVLDYLDEANNKTIQSLQQTADQFGKFADSLHKYRDTLFATDAAQGSAYGALKAKFITTAASAAGGDPTALGGLEGAGKDFLTSAKANAHDWLQYQRDVALVARGVDQGIFAAESTADYAQLQLAALQNATSILQAISDNTAVTAAALAANISSAEQAASGSPIPGPSAAEIASSSPATSISTPSPSTAAMAADSEQVTALKSELEGMRADLNAALQAIAVNTGHTDRLLSRWDRGDGVAITVDSDEPLDVNLASWGGPGAGA